MYATITSTSTSEMDVRKYFYERTNQCINFLSNKFQEKTDILLPPGTQKLKNSSLHFFLVGMYFYARTNQCNIFLSNKFQEKTVILLP